MSCLTASGACVDSRTAWLGFDARSVVAGNVLFGDTAFNTSNGIIRRTTGRHYKHLEGLDETTSQHCKSHCCNDAFEFRYNHHSTDEVTTHRDCFCRQLASWNGCAG